MMIELLTTTQQHVLPSVALLHRVHEMYQPDCPGFTYRFPKEALNLFTEADSEARNNVSFDSSSSVHWLKYYQMLAELSLSAKARIVETAHAIYLIYDCTKRELNEFLFNKRKLTLETTEERSARDFALKWCTAHLDAINPKTYQPITNW